MSERTVCGIDPGIDGALAWHRGGRIFLIEDMPTVQVNASRREVDAARLSAFLYGTKPDLVVLEDVHGLPGDSARGAFSFGRNYGEVLAILKLQVLPTLRIAPQAWKKVILAGTDKSKEAAINYIRQRHPEAELIAEGCRKPSHDRAEAACLACYGATQ